MTVLTTVTPHNTITPIILDKVIGHLAPHFLAASNGDLPTARHAASQILAAYHAENEEELRLAADIVSFGFHALETLAEAADPELSPNRKLRLRGNAVSLNRQSHKSWRKLDQLRRQRLAVSPQPERAPQPCADPVPPTSAAQPDPAAQPDAVLPAATTAQPKTVQAQPISRQQRRAAERLAKKQHRQNVEQARREAARLARRINAPAEGANQYGPI
jgi:pyruvate/2-oxoglutarate dehydrogenase complex dihydrolipoamide acyltransferase (E2) component